MKLLIVFCAVFCGLHYVAASPISTERVEELNDQLFKAAERGDLDSVKNLIENGVNINAKESDGWNALQWASLAGHLNIVKYLVENGAEINVKTNCGSTALHIASKMGRFDIVAYLVKNKANVNAKDNDGKTALDWASANGSKSNTVVEYLITKINDGDVRK